MRKTPKPDVLSVNRKYEKSVQFNTQLGLYDTVRKNENFFIGNQWEGVEANGLPTPVFNLLKRIVLFQVATITSDNIAMQASPLASTSKYELWDIDQITDVINKQFASIFEQNQLVGQIREFMRNAAVDGDGCIYSYFDTTIENGQDVKGEIVTEIIENTRVHFGNPNNRDVQQQPWIMLSRRMTVDEAKDMAEENGVAEDDWEAIAPDQETYYNKHDSMTDDKVTVLTYLYRDKETGTIWKYVCTAAVEIQEPTDTELKLYPLVWLNWDYVQDNYHGQSMITGLLPNQIFINKLFAMSMISLMTTAYPKIVYDKTRIKGWDSRVGAAIGVNGGDMNSVARIIDPAQISPQIAQFIQLAVQMTQEMMGASDVALGSGNAYNTSAIISLQRAAAVPTESVKQNLYRCIESLGRIFMDHMRVFYGTRNVQVNMNIKQEEMPLGIQLPDQDFNRPFDFSILKEIPVSIQLDVGASSYWSEIATQQTLDNLLMQDKISLVDYLERIPNGYITKKQELIEKIKGQQTAMNAMQTPTPPLDTSTELPVKGGSGYGELQRAINETGVAR